MKIKNILNKDAWDIRINKLFKNFFISNFIKTYYYQGINTWGNSEWLGVKTLKAPTDLWIYQELIFKLRPDYIIEIGTYKGGSALYMASICDWIGHGNIITVDIHPCQITHPRITKIVDSLGSTSDRVIEQVKAIVKNGKCLVILDSTHRKQHVLNELKIYSPFVPLEGYIVVEDTCLGGNPVLPSWGDGPMDAVKEFVKNGNFVIDKSLEKFLLTLHPNGFLKRKR